mmetsp:Transcript_15096/g.17093  ORF Transcript_15096/g.17093 Transcript_15096/m.17093 type:complete len:425 (+) Transcript_15096:210-1484(+)
MSFMELKLMSAIENGVMSEVLFCLNSDMNVNYQDEKGVTPLHMACAQGNHNIVRALLSKDDIDVNIKANNGKAALFSAVQSQNVEVLKSMLAHPDIDPNTTDKHATSVAMVATRLRPDILKLVMKHSKIDVNYQKPDGTTVLIYAITTGNTKAALEVIMHPDTDINLQNKRGETAVTIAHKKGLRSITVAFQGMNKGAEGRTSNVRTSAVNDRVSFARSFSQDADRVSRDIPMIKRSLSHQPRKPGFEIKTKGKVKPASLNREHGGIKKAASLNRQPGGIKKAASLNSNGGIKKAASLNRAPAGRQNPENSVKIHKETPSSRNASYHTKPVKVNEEVLLAQRASSMPVVFMDEAEIKRYLETTEVGKVLAANGLKHLAETFMTSHIESVAVAAELSKDELRTCGVTKFTERETLAKLFKAGAKI